MATRPCPVVYSYPLISPNVFPSLSRTFIKAALTLIGPPDPTIRMIPNPFGVAPTPFVLGEGRNSRKG